MQYLDAGLRRNKGRPTLQQSGYPSKRHPDHGPEYDAREVRARGDTLSVCWFVQQNASDDLKANVEIRDAQESKTPYVMHPEELRHRKDRARIPREDSKCHEDHVKEDGGHEEHSQLGVPLRKRQALISPRE